MIPGLGRSEVIIYPDIMFPIQTAISWGYTPWNQGVYIYIYIYIYYYTHIYTHTRMYKRQQNYHKKKNMDIRYLHIVDMVTSGSTLKPLQSLSNDA